MIEGIIFDWVGTLYQFGRKGLFPYSERVLQELKPRYKLAVISKALPEDLDRRTQEINEVGHYFDYIAVNIDKTEDQFLECIKRLGIKPETTLVVDDRTVRGIKIGNKIACQTAWIQTGRYSYETPTQETGEPHYKIKSVEDLLEIL